MKPPPAVISTDVFILTAESQDINGRNTLTFFGRSPEAGPVEIVIHNNQPVFFIDRDAEPPSFDFFYERSQVELKSFSGSEADALYFNTQRDLYQARDILKTRGITTYESDIHPCDRFLMERFINAQASINGAAVTENGLTRFTNPRLKPARVTPELRIASLDIETGVRTDQLYSVAVHVTGAGAEEKQVFMLSDKKTAAAAEGPVRYFPHERDLLKNFLDWLRKTDPDVLIGWNVISFDLAFLEAKARAFGIPFLLGRSARPATVKKKQSGGSYASVPGRVILDGPMILRASFYSFEDFTLETVSQELLGEGKLIAPGKNKISEIDRMFNEDKEALAGYNLQDCVLVTRIFEKTGLVDLCIKRAQISGMLMDELGISTAAFDHFYLPRLHRKGYVASNIDDVKLLEHAAGGHVLSPVTGLHENVLVMDFKSLYPSIIRTFSIDPLSRLAGAKAQSTDVSVTPKGFKFSKSAAILPDFIKELMERRGEAAAKKDAHLSQAIKILMNSFYGVMGSGGCRFYHPDLPTAITSTGQWLLLGSKDFFEGLGHKVLYGDTDSLFVKFADNKKLSPDKLGAELAAALTEYWRKKLEEDFQVTSYLEVKYEKFYKKFLLPLARTGEGGAKKRYAGMRLDKNGKESLEFIGMEFVRSDWTKLAKEFQEKLYWRLFHGEDVESWIKELIQEVREGRLDEKLIYRKRLRKEAAEYTKSVPPHVKAARMLDRPVRQIRYLITLRGPVPVELTPKDIDYQHYIDKQLAPIADSILGLMGKSFDGISRPTQFTLFE